MDKAVGLCRRLGTVVHALSILAVQLVVCTPGHVHIVMFVVSLKSTKSVLKSIGNELVPLKTCLSVYLTVALKQLCTMYFF